MNGRRLVRALIASAVLHGVIVAGVFLLTPNGEPLGPVRESSVEVMVIARESLEKPKLVHAPRVPPGSDLETTAFSSQTPPGETPEDDAGTGSILQNDIPPEGNAGEETGGSVAMDDGANGQSRDSAATELGAFRDLRRLVDEGVSFAPRGGNEDGNDPFAKPPPRGSINPLFAAPTDSIDGVPDLGSGERGDPRIPGSGGVDIGSVARRDGTVGIARLRASQGQVHPYLKDVKDELENCWLPVGADAAALARDREAQAAAIQVFDPGCAAGAHARFKIARVEAVYDANGARLAFRLVGATKVKDLADRVHEAFDRTAMPEVPRELLGEDGRLHVAWNVFLDDYSMCNLMGQGANAHKPGGDTYIGIVELDGLY